MAKISNISPDNLASGYSQVLFYLYKLKDDENLSTLSELPFILDSKNLMNLLEYYGGRTVKFPTKSDLLTVIAAISLLQNKDFQEDQYDQYNIGQNLNKQDVLQIYRKLKAL